MLAVCAAQSASAIATWRTEQTQIADAHGTVLRPQPGVAAAEQPQPLKDGCEVSLSAKTFSPECRYLPDAGRGDVVLVGDSHAVQWYSGVRAVAARRSWGLRVWARASCPLADVSKVGAGGPAQDCNAWRENVMGRLLTARPSLVIVAGYASIVPSLYDRTSGRLVRGAAARALYETGLRTELRRLRDAGIAVLLIRDNPAFDVSGPKCALEHADHLAACSVTRRHALQTTVELRAAHAVPGVHVLDNTSLYCDARRCHQVIGSTLAYRDSNHLTLKMVSSLTARLGAAADQAISG